MTQLQVILKFPAEIFCCSDNCPLHAMLIQLVTFARRDMEASLGLAFGIWEAGQCNPQNIRLLCSHGLIDLQSGYQAHVVYQLRGHSLSQQTLPAKHANWMPVSLDPTH